ncbi:conserved protein of unknown function [Pseudorhizobium banfieldiae]|uniref:Metallo-beta-lactamase family protein n=1 Tax=Pseudorhizobium banfieldiae TaxID=1125847 RepID=L0NIT9_9HYPH|nr:MBL fold metallo-hydrolase [Pseudorhizobium banfieldiae]CAD6617558.1 MBL fold metallo-hydrolase [arsenite-oxidising bacterium NT-25]CCF20799.1 conserved protein of unknown function [Pseudorhizobium banfieldiae]
MAAEPTISFHGAAGGVTGSCFLLRANERSILIDCGLFQGSKTEKELSYRAFPFSPSTVDAVILTHSHIDHSGLLPKLVKEGYRGPIYCTPASLDLCAVMLPDSAHIQEMEVEQLNRRNRRRGRPIVSPIYTSADAANTLVQMRTLPYRQWCDDLEDTRFRLWNAGHLLGSASVELEIRLQTETLRILFSGDIGPQGKLLQHEPEAPAQWDYVICESTYGDEDRVDISPEQRRALLREEVNRAARSPNGALVIPSFAVDRTQELLTDLVVLMDQDLISPCPVVIDSPLASRATGVFRRNVSELERGDLLQRALSSRHVRFTETFEQSKALDDQMEFHIVIAASGMCEAGRIRHRLKRWLWREEATVLLVGYQAEGTLGRLLEQGARTVRIQGDDIAVKASIRNLDVYSGHADAKELVDWIRQRLPIKTSLFLVHGETSALEGLHRRIEDIDPGFSIIQPSLDSTYMLGRSESKQTSPEVPPRLPPLQVGSRDWHNDFQGFVLDLQERLATAADDKARRVILRRVMGALDEDERSTGRSSRD